MGGSSPRHWARITKNRGQKMDRKCRRGTLAPEATDGGAVDRGWAPWRGVRGQDSATWKPEWVAPSRIRLLPFVKQQGEDFPPSTGWVGGWALPNNQNIEAWHLPNEVCTSSRWQEDEQPPHLCGCFFSLLFLFLHTHFLHFGGSCM